VKLRKVERNECIMLLYALCFIVGGCGRERLLMKVA